MATNHFRIVATSPLAAVAIALTFILSDGCATKPAPSRSYIFFPAMPDPPRVQFLTSYSSEKEMGAVDSGFASFITGAKPVNRTIGKPYGLALQQDKIYVCDSAVQQILTLDLDKRHIDTLKVPDEISLSEPLNISFDADGTRYIVDDGRDQVFCISAANQVKWVMGHKDEMRPRDVAVTGDRLYVADIKGHCVRVYDKPTQSLLFCIPKGKDATNSANLLVLPSNIAVDDQGQLYASDTAAGRVQVYDRDGNYVRSLGGFGDDPQFGLLKRPKGVAVDRAGVVYVVDAAYQLVQMFDKEGRYLMCFGYPGSSSAAGLTLPAKIIVDYDHVKLFVDQVSPRFKVEYLLIVSNQYGPRKVAIYGFGHQQ